METFLTAVFMRNNAIKMQVLVKKQYDDFISLHQNLQRIIETFPEFLHFIKHAMLFIINKENKNAIHIFDAYR